MADDDEIRKLFNELTSSVNPFGELLRNITEEISYRNRFGYFLMTDEQKEKMTPAEKHVYGMFHQGDEDR